MSENYGFEENEVCGREGCDGTIQLEDTDSCCSCHISPPCSHCVDDRHYCPKCDWHAIDDQKKTYSYSSASTYPVYQYKTNHQKLAGDWVPYASHIDAGRFYVTTGTGDNDHNFTSAKFTPKGVEWVGRLWNEYTCPAVIK